MRIEKFIETLENEKGTGHSFYDPFVRDGADPDNGLESMIEIALETHGEEKTCEGKLSGWALTSRKYLRQFRSDEEFRREATEAVRAQARLTIAAAALDELTENTNDTGETVDDGAGHVVSFRGAVESIVARIPARLADDLFGRTTTFRSQTAWRADDLAELMGMRCD